MVNPMARGCLKYGVQAEYKAVHTGVGEPGG